MPNPYPGEDTSRPWETGGFFPDRPPAPAARWLARFVVALFLALAATAARAPLPETVQCPLTLAPRELADAVRAPAAGTIVAAPARPGQTVAKGGLLFVVRSRQALTWQNELEQVKREIEGYHKRRAILAEAHGARARAAAAKARALAGQVQFQRQYLAAYAQVLSRMEKLAQRKAISPMNLLSHKLKMAEARRDLSQAEHGLSMARDELAEMASREKREETELATALAKAQIRVKGLTDQLAGGGEGLVKVTAPFAAVVLSVSRGQAGEVVSYGAELARLAPLKGDLVAVLRPPQTGVPRLAPGQPVQLLFDAFPYMRYGAGQAVLTWVSPAPVAVAGGESFLARARPTRGYFPDSGRKYGLKAGMAGTARVRVGSRTLLEYVFQPVRALRETLAPPAFKKNHKE